MTKKQTIPPQNEIVNKDMIKAMFNYASESIIISNKKGEIIIANPQAEKSFGYVKKELIGKSIESLIPNRFAEKHSLNVEKYTKNPSPRSMGIGMDLFAKRKDGSEFPVEISLNSFSNDDGLFIIVFVIDISTRINLNRELANALAVIKELNLELEQRVTERTNELAKTNIDLANSNKELQKEISERKQIEKELKIVQKELLKTLIKEKDLNELKSRFVSMASHEFRTPLSTILSSVSLVEKYSDPAFEEKRLKHIKRIKSNIGNLVEILNDMLSLGKLDEGKVLSIPVLFDISKFSEDLTEEMQAVAKPDQKIIYKHSGKIKQVIIDKLLLKNVLMNLLNNAIKYSPEGKEIEFRTFTNPTNVIISIKDNGIGIPESDYEHLFKRFYRAKNAINIQGTGLGLNIVNKYLNLMGGTISFVSEINLGTEFTIQFPVK